MPRATRLTDSERRAWLAKCWVTSCDVGFGCRLYLAFHPEYVGPIGIVWTTGSGGAVPTCDVWHSYVLPYYRRRGVRTLLNRQLLVDYAVIRTMDGSRSGGLAFLKAAGYTHDPVRGDWYLRRTSFSQRGSQRRRRCR